MSDLSLKEFCEEEIVKRHEQDSKHGFDICYKEKEGDVYKKKYLDVQIYDEELVWEIAKGLAERNRGLYINIYVTYFDVEGGKPVMNYQDKCIKNY